MQAVDGKRRLLQQARHLFDQSELPADEVRICTWYALRNALTAQIAGRLRGADFEDAIQF